MAYKAYCYKGTMFYGGYYALAFEATPIFCKQTYDQIFEDFDSITPIGDWITLTETVDPGGYHHTGFKRYFCLDGSDRQMAIILRDYWEDQGSIAHEFRYSIMAANTENTSEYGDGWELECYPTTFYDDGYGQGHKWWNRDTYQILVVTDENNKVVGLSAPQAEYLSHGDGNFVKPVSMMMFDRESETIAPGYNVTQRTPNYSQGRWVAGYKTPYKMKGKILTAFYAITQYTYRLPSGSAFKESVLYNDFFHNTYAYKGIEIYAFLGSSEDWESETYLECMRSEGQLYMHIGNSMFIPLSEKNEVEVDIWGVPMYPIVPSDNDDDDE